MNLRNARVTVVGDFCLDAYWHLDTTASPPISLETGLPMRCVRRQEYSLGGAGNVAANLIDLGVGKVRAIGAIGRDFWGSELVRILKARGADVAGIMTVEKDWQTMVYAKPYLGDVEEQRIDFGGFNHLKAESVDELLASIDRAAGESDVVILNQQVPSGLTEDAVISRINKVIASHPKTRFIVDARDSAAKYRGASLKLNAHEAARLLGDACPVDSIIGIDVTHRHAKQLSKQTGQPVFITRGERGLIVADGETVTEIPGIQVIQQTDTVGAGDTVVAALAAVLGSGGDSLSAARLANIAASITVKKLRITGTANPDEIRAVGPSPDFVYAPDLADDARSARYVDGSEIELIRDLPADIHIRHAIFDHDGTLSTLRQGWEKIMEPMMIRAVLGRKFKEAEPAVYRAVTESVRELIDKTTGIQTLVQMQALVQLIKRCGFVPAGEVLDEHGYKKIYNDELLDMVRQRVAKLERGELEPADFQIKNADLLLKKLHAKGVKLYLASGTDETDVIAEAKAMGYADLFEGRIFGAVGDVNVEAKKIVLEKIIRDNRLAGHEFVTFGDGPVEMRETHKRGGICVGLCSDEVQRYGLNPAKRGRLIRGGAGLLVPDFSQMDRLLKLLHLA